MKTENKTLLLYILKCATGCLIIFTLSWLFNYPDISWCLISVTLVITPESSEAVTLAMTRIKANLVGGGVSLLISLFGLPIIVKIILAIAVTVIICHLLKIMAGSRSAIAACIIILLHGFEHDEPFFWSTTLERIASVVVGCVIGLLVTLFFHSKFFKKKSIVSDKAGDA